MTMKFTKLALATLLIQFASFSAYSFQDIRNLKRSLRAAANTQLYSTIAATVSAASEAEGNSEQVLKDLERIKQKSTELLVIQTDLLQKGANAAEGVDQCTDADCEIALLAPFNETLFKYTLKGTEMLIDLNDSFFKNADLKSAYEEIQKRLKIMEALFTSVGKTCDQDKKCLANAHRSISLNMATIWAAIDKELAARIESLNESLSPSKEGSTDPSSNSNSDSKSQPVDLRDGSWT